MRTLSRTSLVLAALAVIGACAPTPTETPAAEAPRWQQTTLPADSTGGATTTSADPGFQCDSACRAGGGHVGSGGG